MKVKHVTSQSSKAVRTREQAAMGGYVPLASAVAWVPR